MSMTLKKQLGDFGENLVAQFLRDCGLKVDLSEDVFDSQKDMMAENETLEVKTLVPIKKFKAFAIEPNQWKKLDEVDRLFFVEVPEANCPVRIFESISRLYIKTYFVNGTKRMYQYSDLRLVRVIDDAATTDAIRNLSDSSYKG